ncbi:MAG TPA: tetratricopeptide repeat protein [Pirellulales bacterium]|jgi:tetratricopeptide (TPR) repeat protein|nr:tetratricopeptide repeat protein [Pirellulales bacterium]
MPPALIQSQPSQQRQSEREAGTWRAIAVCWFLVLTVLLVFGRTFGHGFLNWDDNLYVYNEPHVSGGLSWSDIVWAFTNGPAGERYPLSMLSHMLDCQLHGLRPAGHHLTNVLLHAATAVGLFLVLRRMTGALWPSALVAALFALHPMRVESVAWVAERRDVLSGLFFVLTLAAYAEYVRRPKSLGRYLAVVGMFALGLLAKPMLVTLPPLLLLLDFWPLRRFGQTQPEMVAGQSLPAVSVGRIVLEKVPLLALALVAAGVTMSTHGEWFDPLAIGERFSNAAVSCLTYLVQSFVPVGLSPFYSHPESGRAAWQIVAALAVLLAITAAAVIGRRSYPYFFVGWFWYLGTLVPVLGLISVGAHARADRYMYLSQIGLDVALVWGAMRIGASWPARKWVFGIGSAVVLATLGICTWQQAGYWRDGQTLWERALACDPTSVTAHYNLGLALEGEGKDESGAEAHYRQAVEIGPNERNIYYLDRAKAYDHLSNIAARRGDIAGAIALYKQAIESDPSCAAAHINLATLLFENNNFDEAINHFQRSIELSAGKATPEPNMDVVHTNLATLLAERGDVDEAIRHLHRAIEIEPDAAFPYHQLATLLRKQGKASEAAEYDHRGVQASHRFAKAQNRRGTELVEQGKIGEAIAQFKMAIATAPDDAQAHNNLANALTERGSIDEAIMHYRRALELDPNLTSAKLRLKQFINH